MPTLKVVVGVVYTPFIPGGYELENATAELEARLHGCNARVIDAAMDALAVIEEARGADVLVLLAPDPDAQSISLEKVTLPTRSYDPSEVVEGVRASLEGSLYISDLVNALDRLSYALGVKLQLVIVRCAPGYCRNAVDEAAKIALELGCRSPSGLPEKQVGCKE